MYKFFKAFSAAPCHSSWISLPLAHANTVAGGKGISALARLAVEGLLLLPLTLQANVGTQIDEAVENYLEEILDEEAARQGWLGASLVHETRLPRNAGALASCERQLLVQATRPAASILDRQRLEISCPDEQGWTAKVVVEANVYLPAVHAERVIERGESIRQDDLKQATVSVRDARRGFYQEQEEVVGMVAKRRIRADQTISPNLLDRPLAVRRGQPVTIVASQDGIEASTLGEALSDGRTGEIIRVRNASSENVIDAKVLEPGVVTSTF